MKKLILLSFAAFFTLQAYSWFPFGPPGIVATNICFASEPISTAMVCTNDGMYVHSEYGNQWDFFSIDGLPVQEGVFPDSDNILLVCGDSTDSDGIYSFNVANGQFTLKASCDSPKFIKHDEYAGKYYVGYKNGLLVSDDGDTWEDVAFFQGKPCIEMAIYYTYLSVSVNIASPNVFWSDNSGASWNSSSSPAITRMTYYGTELFGVIPGTSYSSGLYKSMDYGNTWEVEFWSFYISTVCYDDFDGGLYVGWDNPDAGYEGIALYDGSGSTSGLTFFNDGLPDTHINRIQYMPGIDFYSVLVCTDSGVFAYTYTGINGQNFQPDISVSPNPVKDEMLIELKTDILQSDQLSIEIYNNEGQLLDEIMPGLFDGNRVKWSRGDLMPGLYYLNIKTNKKQFSKKFIIL